MKDMLAMLQDIRRPRLLIQAARIGSENYQPAVHLPRILGYGTKVLGARALMQLVEMESELDEKRRSGDASYNVSRHVDVLCAMMGEARLLRVTRQEHELSVV